MTRCTGSPASAAAAASAATSAAPAAVCAYEYAVRRENGTPSASANVVSHVAPSLFAST